MKVVVEYRDESFHSLKGDYLCPVVEPAEGFTPYVEPNDSETTLLLVKQGVTVDEIIKLKNNELI